MNKYILIIDSLKLLLYKKPYTNLFPKIALFKAVSDGAADKLLECMEDENDKFTPDLISGDFDSATKSVIDYYKQKVGNIDNSCLHFTQHA